jgi:excisionase family DNA binding protein
MTKAKPAPPDPLTTAQVAAATAASVWTVQGWIRSGLLPARRSTSPGRPYLIERADLDEFLARQPTREDPLAQHIRRVLAGDGHFPEPTDDQIRLIARLLPRRGPQEADDVA